MSDLTHHPRCSSVGGDACDCSGRVISTERPPDLARWRALVEEALASAAACSLDLKSPESLRMTHALATALRSLCDEVERLRGENSGLQEVLRHLERKAWGGDTTISGFRKWVAERCGAALPPCDPSSQEAP